MVDKETKERFEVARFKLRMSEKRNIFQDEFINILLNKFGGKEKWKFQYTTYYISWDCSWETEQRFLIYQGLRLLSPFFWTMININSSQEQNRGLIFNLKLNTFVNMSLFSPPVFNSTKTPFWLPPF